MLPRRLRNALRTGFVLALLVGVNVYVFFFRRGTSLGAVLHAAAVPSSQVASWGVATAGSTSAQEAVDRGGDVLPERRAVIVLGRGERVVEAIERGGVPRGEARAVSRALSRARAGRLVAGTRLAETFDTAGHLDTLALRAAGRPVVIHRDARGAYDLVRDVPPGRPAM